MPSSLNVCTTLILFSRAWTGDSSYFSTLLIKVPGTLFPVTMYCSIDLQRDFDILLYIFYYNKMSYMSSIDLHRGSAGLLYAC